MMKKWRINNLFIVAAFLIVNLIPKTSNAGSWNGWVYQSSYPTSNTLLAVKFVTSMKGWMAGAHGTILYTKDGGENWAYQESGTEQDLKSISFIDEKRGWAIGNGGVIRHTENGGKTWKPQKGASSNLHKVFFLNNKEGWAVGDMGTVLHTTDSGTTWNQIKIATARTIGGIYFLDTKTGWLLAGDEIYRTTDGGNKWEKTKLDVKRPQANDRRRDTFPTIEQGLPGDWWKSDIFFLDHKKGWAVVGDYFIFRTEDGGKAWESINLGEKSYALHNITFMDDKTGCAGGTSIVCTEDGGKTWKERMGVPLGGREAVDGFLVTIWALVFPDPSTGWAVGLDGQIWKTTDRGKNWKSIRRSRPFGYVWDSKTSWGLSQQNSIVKSEDGGNTWEIQKTFKSDDVWIKFFFIDKSTGWAVGQEFGRDRRGLLILDYFILNTSDGGKTWLTQLKEPGGPSCTSNQLKDLFFINSNTGWVVGYNGLILHTEDGGLHWSYQNSGVKYGLRGVQFINAKLGWAVGDKSEGESKEIGVILHTADGGVTWKEQWKKKSDWIALRDVTFLNEDIGWVMADIDEYSGNAILLHTMNGGETWSETKKFKEIDYSNFFFLDNNYGVILSHKGYLLMTTDGGTKWSKKLMPLHRYPWHISEMFIEHK